MYVWFLQPHLVMCASLPKQFQLPSVNLFVQQFFIVCSVIISRLHYGNYCCGTITTLTNAQPSGLLSLVCVCGGGCTYLRSQFFGSSAWSHWEWMQTCLSPLRGWKQPITKKWILCTSLSKIEQLSGELLHIHMYTHIVSAQLYALWHVFPRRQDIPLNFSQHSYLLHSSFLGKVDPDAAGLVKITTFFHLSHKPHRFISFYGVKFHSLMQAVYACLRLFHFSLFSGSWDILSFSLFTSWCFNSVLLIYLYLTINSTG